MKDRRRKRTVGEGRRQFLMLGSAGIAARLWCSPGALQGATVAAADDSIQLQAGSGLRTKISYKSALEGVLTTPGGSRPTVLSVTGNSQFDFEQLHQGGPVDELEGQRLTRRYLQAKVSTRVGRSHETATELPPTSSLMHLYGHDGQLVQLSPAVRLTRAQLDLLQFPCDPIAVTGLLPGRSLAAATEKWNTDAWVFPQLVGMDAAISQSVSGQILELSAQEARIGFECRGSGAVTGSATEVSLQGTLVFDRGAGLIRRFNAVLKEDRSAGPVSPGLKVSANISWTQEPTGPNEQLAALMPVEFPEAGRLLLTYITPWRLVLLHDRRWHVFQESAELVILRMLTNGALTAQCNLAAAPRMPAGRFTEEGKFLAEIEEKIGPWKGGIVAAEVESDRRGWRVHRVRAEAEVQSAAAGAALGGGAGGDPVTSTASATGPGKRATQTIVWQYFLCTAKSGEQFSLVFSHAAEDTAAFRGVPEQFLDRLSIRG